MYASASSRYLMAGATRIHYRVDGRGPNLLLLHGELSSLRAWDAWVRELAASYRIIRIDLPGFGLSDQLGSDDYTPEHVLELVEQVRANFHLERFHLAGHSLGGFLSWYYAAHHPDRVERLILLEPIGYPQKLPPFASLLSQPGIGELVRAGAPRFLVARLLRAAYGDPRLVTDELVDRYHALLSRRRHRVALVRTFRRLRAYHDDAALCRQIPLVRAPTLLLWGQLDRWVPAALLASWRRDLPTAEVRVYPGVGHLPMEELPGQTARDAHEFLSPSERRAFTDAPIAADTPPVRLAHARGA